MKKQEKHIVLRYGILKKKNVVKGINFQEG